MKVVHVSLTGAAALVAGLVPVWAADTHVTVISDTIEWAAAPASLPPGAEAAILFGDPSANGQFAMRLKLPDGYHIAPQTHPGLENVTVISGSFHLGMGDDPDEDDTVALTAGSFVSMPAGMVHFAYADGETVVQLNTVGPWGLTYVDPADDPRKTN